MIIYLAILCALFGMVKSPVKMVVGDLQIGDQVGSRLESPGVHPIFLLRTSFFYSVFSMFHPEIGERILGPFLGICHGMRHLCDLVGKWRSISGKDLKNW